MVSSIPSPHFSSLAGGFPQKGGVRVVNREVTAIHGGDSLSVPQPPIKREGDQCCRSGSEPPQADSVAPCTHMVPHPPHDGERGRGSRTTTDKSCGYRSEESTHWALVLPPSRIEGKGPGPSRLSISKFHPRQRTPVRAHRRVEGPSSESQFSGQQPTDFLATRARRSQWIPNRHNPHLNQQRHIRCCARFNSQRTNPSEFSALPDKLPFEMLTPIDPD